MSSPADRLAAAVLARRTALAWNQLQVAANGGPSNTTQTEIENARTETLTNITAKKIDAGLGWQPGSAMRVWKGEGEPVVGGDGKGGTYVKREPRTADEKVEDEATDNAVLDAIQQMQRDLQALRDELGEVRNDVAGLSERMEDRNK